MKNKKCHTVGTKTTTLSEQFQNATLSEQFQNATLSEQFQSPVNNRRKGISNMNII